MKVAALPKLTSLAGFSARPHKRQPIVAPIHLLSQQRRGGLADWGMNTAPYTPLELLLLFQALLVHGVEAAAFARVSDLLKANALIRHDASYDAARLSPDALRQLFLHLVREELRSEAAANANASPNPNTDANPALSPNSRKRKAQSPPLPSLKEVIDNFGKIPVLVEKLYARYREQTVRAIREDERRAVALQREIHALEQAEREEEKARLDAKRLPAAAQAQTATPVPAPSPSPTPTPDLQPPPQPPKGPSPVPATTPHNAPSPGPVAIQPAVPTPSPVPVQAKPSPGPHQQHQIPSRNVAPPSGPSPPPPPPPTAVPQAQTPSLTPQGKAQQPFKPTGPPSQVLQPPMGASQPPPRNLQSTTPVPLPAISPRPDAAKPKTPGPAAAVPVPIPQPGTPSTLKWEKPYQPPGSAAPLQGRPTQPQPLATNAPLPTHLKRTLRLKLLFKPLPRLYITPMYKYHDHSSHLYSISSRYSFPHKLELNSCRLHIRPAVLHQVSNLLSPLRRLKDHHRRPQSPLRLFLRRAPPLLNHNNPLRKLRPATFHLRTGLSLQLQLQLL
ncbi:hypothetical protein HYQ45_006388 [Verticillium longisporum]|uniref:Uncharacterized protein n=1 Tax=Verticillium longisporum TaxID=100787 RepID=A0A8I3AR38_VERLO|nr:hypothetical protein HYQ45_006388 [Verticillium longisporum]